MADDPGGGAATTGATGGNSRRPGRNRNSSNRRGNRNSSSIAIKGKTEAISQHVYDISPKYRNTFNRTTVEIAGYIARTLPGGGEFLDAMKPDNLGFLPLDDPPYPESSDPMSLEIWKLSVKSVFNRREKRAESMKQAFAIVLGQVSEALQDRLEADESFASIQTSCDLIELLTLIRRCMQTGSSKTQDMQALQEAQERLTLFKQSPTMTNARFLQNFNDLVQTCELYGMSFGIESWEAFLNVDQSSASESQIANAKENARDSHLATLFLRKSDDGRYKGLKADIQNAFTRGSDEYPKSITAAYDYLVNYVPPPYYGVSHDEQHGMTFVTDEQSDTQSDRGGRGGRGRGRGSGRGRGRGRGRSGNRGRQDSTPGTEESAAHVADQPDETQDSGDQTTPAGNDTVGNDNLDQDDQYVDYCNLARAESYLQSAGLPKRWLLLDSCSSATIISNPSLLSNIRKSETSLPVRSLGGLIHLEHIADFGDFPEPVWHHPNGIANILSLSDVSKHFRVTMDTNEFNGLIIHINSSTLRVFSNSAKNLYRIDLSTMTNSDASHFWAPTIDAVSHLETVEDIKKLYPRRLYERAVRARKFQNIIMRPGSRQMKDIIIPHMQNCPITKADIDAAEHLFGPNLGALLGRTTRTTPDHVINNVDPVPTNILRVHRNLTLLIDIMFVNKLPFLVTISRHLKFGTIEPLDNRQIPTIVAKLRAVVKLYNQRGFSITGIYADHEFEPLRASFPQLNTAAANEHVPEIERFIRTIKERTRAAYNMLPYKHVPRLMLLHLVRNAVFWLNAFPRQDGISSVHSPRYILTGRHLDYTKHAIIEFGAYVQTHEEHDNSMDRRTMGAICLGPTGNVQGGHWFMSLTSGSRVIRYRWTPLPMPTDVIVRVSNMGQAQGMPSTVTYSDRVGRELRNSLNEIADDASLDDSTYVDDDMSVASSDDQSDTDDNSADDDDSSAGDDDSSDDDYDSDDDRPPEGLQPMLDDPLEAPVAPPPTTIGTDTRVGPPEATGVNNVPLPRTGVDNNGPVGTTGVEADRPFGTTGVEADRPVGTTGVEGPFETNETDESTEYDQDEVFPNNDTPEYDNELDNMNEQDAADVPLDTTGVDIPAARGVETPSITTDITTEWERFQSAVRRGEDAANDDTELPKRIRKPKTLDSFLATFFNRPEYAVVPEECFIAAIAPHAEELMNFLTEQMNAKKGLKVFGERGVKALNTELKQLLTRKVMFPVAAQSLSYEERIAALKYLMFLKEKRSGQLKGRGCADGRKQRVYKTKEETYAPTVSTEAVILTSMIDAREGRDIAIVDIPGAFMQADIDEIVHVKLEGDLVDLIVRLDPSYQAYITYEGKKQNRRKVIYTKLTKALYGTMQAAYLFWKKLSSFLVEKLGFKINPYDSCVANKTVNGKQCTICWHVDDLKISHAYSSCVTGIINALQKEFGKEAPLTVKRGKVFDDYLGMHVDFSQTGKVIFRMEEYITQVVTETPDALMRGPCSTPAGNHLFQTNKNAVLLNEKDKELFHHLTAKLLYLSKRTRPDIQTAISFLCTRVQEPDEDDMKKLGRCIRYLSTTRTLPLTLEFDGSGIIRWWVDASFAVHPNMRSHTGATMSMGKGSPFSISSKQKLNTRSSTEAELVGVNDAMGLILWTRKFLEAQGLTVTDNIIHQDNQSTMLLANNGRRSSSKQTRHIEIRYYFITDNILRKQCRVDYCPTEEMRGDFFTKPLQGKLFLKHRDAVLNLSTGPSVDDTAPQECVGASPEPRPHGRTDRPANESETLLTSDHDTWHLVERKRKKTKDVRFRIDSTKRTNKVSSLC